MVTQDYGEAVKWYRKAAEQGFKFAQNALGDCYYKGKGVTQDYAEAVKWYRKAAEQGFSWAQENLGDCYSKGHGVKQDKGIAAEWYNKVVKQHQESIAKGDTIAAQKNLDRMKQEGKI